MIRIKGIVNSCPPSEHYPLCREWGSGTVEKTVCGHMIKDHITMNMHKMGREGWGMMQFIALFSGTITHYLIFLVFHCFLSTNCIRATQQELYVWGADHSLSFINLHAVFKINFRGYFPQTFSFSAVGQYAAVSWFSNGTLLMQIPLSCSQHSSQLVIHPLLKEMPPRKC